MGAGSCLLAQCQQQGGTALGEGQRKAFHRQVDETHLRIAQDNSRSRLVFMGSGSSSGTPIGFCITEDSATNERCAVARKSLLGAAHENKDFRLNPSLLVHHVLPNGGGDTLVQIDVGKTFREGIVRWCVAHMVWGTNCTVHGQTLLGATPPWLPWLPSLVGHFITIHHPFFHLPLTTTVAVYHRYPRRAIPRPPDAFVLTHAHADAILG